MEGVISCSLNTHDTEIPVQMVDLSQFKIDESSPATWGIPMGTSTFIHKLYVMLAKSITDPRTREVLSWKEDDLSFEIKDYRGFDLLMGALFFRHKKWPARFCHYIYSQADGSNSHSHLVTCRLTLVKSGNDGDGANSS